MTLRSWFAGCALSTLLVQAASAQSNPAAAAPAADLQPVAAIEIVSAAPAAETNEIAPDMIGGILIPAGTVVDLEVAELVSSKTAKRGDRFAIRMVRPIVVDGIVVVAEGTLGVGEVTTVGKPGMSGKPGELMVLARYLDHHGLRLPLKGMKLGQRGPDHTFEAFVIAYALTPLAMFIQGGHMQFPAGTAAQARLSADVVVPAPVPAT